MRRRCVVITFLVFALISTGCTSAPKAKPAGVTPVTLDAATRRASIMTRLGMEVRLELPPPREPGNVWQIIQNDARFLQPLTEISAPSPVTGRSTVRFHAVRMGRSQLKFLAVPAVASAVADPVDFYDVLVTVQ